MVAPGLDETTGKRGLIPVIILIKMDRGNELAIFIGPGTGTACVAAFRELLFDPGGKPARVAEVVRDLSPVFLVALAKNFANAAITIGWFHVVQLFTTAVDQAR